MADKTRTFDINVQPLPGLKAHSRPPKDAEPLPDLDLVNLPESAPRPRRRHKVTREIVIRLIDWFEGA